MCLAVGLWPGGTVRRMPPAWIGLTLAFGSALATNTAYSFEHDAAAALPPLSPRRPFRSAQLLLRDRRWLTAFAGETAGWLMYVAALRLAPLALVQSVAASGVAVLAFATVRGHLSRLAWRERLAVVLALAGLTLLALSLAGTTASDQRPEVIGVVIWLAACGGAAALLIVIPTRFGRAASLGLAAGLLFADGDMSAKLVGYGGLWLVALATLIVAYGIGTSVLQSAYQRGDALTAAGTATMVTNAVPIAAGFVLFGETLPHGARAVLQIAAFACLVASAVMLGHRQVPRAGDPTPRSVLSRSLLPNVGSTSRRCSCADSAASRAGTSPPSQPGPPPSCGRQPATARRHARRPKRSAGASSRPARPRPRPPSTPGTSTTSPPGRRRRGSGPVR